MKAQVSVYDTALDPEPIQVLEFVGTDLLDIDRQITDWLASIFVEKVVFDLEYVEGATLAAQYGLSVNPSAVRDTLRKVQGMKGRRN